MMFDLLQKYGKPAWITDSDHFGRFLDLVYGPKSYGEIWLYNNDLNVLLNPDTFRTLYCHAIFGELWDRIDAVKVLVSKRHKEEVFGPNGSIPSQDLRHALLALSKLRNGGGTEKLKSFFFGETPEGRDEGDPGLRDEYTIVFYLHQHSLVAKPRPSGIVMVRPHSSPFFEKDASSQYAVVWQLVDQQKDMDSRLLRFNEYFVKGKFFYVSIENGEPKLVCGWSEPYLEQQEKRKSQECDGLFIGEETDYLILSSNYEELRAIEDALGPVHGAPIRGDAYKVFFHRRGNDILKIILGFTGQGNLVAAIKTWEAINIWKPREVIFVGVAGGDPLDNNINIGDVIIGEEILAYEHAKVVEVKNKNKKWEYLPKHRQWPASEVKSKAERLAQEWGKNIPQQYLKPIGREGQNIRAIVQPIASGNKLIVSPSYFTEVGKRTGRSFKAVEMEGDGVCQACNLKGKRALVIRGIMDKCTPASRGDDDEVSRNVNNTMLKGDAYREEIRRAVAGIVASFVRDLLIEKE